MAILRFSILIVCILSFLGLPQTAFAESKTEGGGIGFVLLQALQRKRTDPQAHLFSCSQTFRTTENNHSASDGTSEILADVYAIKIHPFTRKFQIFTKINNEQICVIEKLETLLKRHSCLKDSFPALMKQAVDLARDYQVYYRNSRAPSPQLQGFSPEEVQYELIVSSTTKDLQYIRPTKWNWFNWGRDNKCNFRYFLRQRITTPESWEPLIVSEDELHSEGSTQF